MFIPTKNRLEVFKYLFKEGVIVVNKDFYQAQHETVPVPNLEVMQVMKSLKSRELVRETYSWNTYYYFLTDAGAVYLREAMGIPEAFLPATFKITARPADEGRRREGGNRERRERPEGGREGGREGGYRRGPRRD